MDEKFFKLLKDALDFVSYYNNPKFRKPIDEDIDQNERIKLAGKVPRYATQYLNPLISFSSILYRRYLQAMNEPNKSFPEKIKNFLIVLPRYGTEISRLRQYIKVIESTTSTAPDSYSEPPSQPQRPLLLNGLLRRIGRAGRRKKVPEKEKQVAAYFLSEKIRQHRGDFVNSQKREELIQNGVFSKDEVEAILKAGLVKWAEGGVDRDFQNEDEWNSSVYETASGVLERQYNPPLPKISFGVNIPFSKIVSPLKNIRINTQFLQKAGSTLSPMVKGLTRSLVKGALTTGARGALAAAGPIGWVALALSSATVRKTLKKTTQFVVAGIAVGIFMIYSFFFDKNSLFFPPFDTDIAESSPIGPPQSTEAVNSCKFVRSDQNPRESSYQSSVLINYFKDASIVSGIPISVFAAFTRVESPSLTRFADQDLASFGCPESPTGALGLMQIQPKGTVGHDSSAVGQGASFIGKSYEELTRSDYCDMRKNILIGAGFILKKMSYFGYGNGTRWDPKWTEDKNAINTLVNSYYGCLLYGGKKDCEGPYNYGDDVWESIRSCRVIAPSTVTAPPPQSGNYQSWIKDNFGVSFREGFKENVYKWAYEILYESQKSAPQFRLLLKEKAGQGVEIIPFNGISHRSGNNINFRNTPTGPTSDETLFKLIFIHELAHVINGSRPGQYKDQVLSAVKADGKFLTTYAFNASADNDLTCNPGENNTSVQADENFAEMVTYYINSETPEKSSSYQCGELRNLINPFKTGKYPNQLQVIKSILGEGADKN